MHESPKDPFGPGPNMKVIGNAPDVVKKSVEDGRRNRLHVHDLAHISESSRNELEQLEYPKTSQERFIIDHVNAYTGRLLKQAGMPAYDVPEKNVHILPHDLYEKTMETGSKGSAVYPEQAILLDASHVRKSGVLFGSITVHEVLHLKGATVVRMRGNEEVKDFYGKPFRQGMSVFSTEKTEEDFGGYEYFAGLHEAVVAFAEKAYIKELLQTPEMQEERQQWESLAAVEKRRDAARVKNVTEDDIVWLGTDGAFESRGYPMQRKVLEFLLEEVAATYPDRFPTQESVYNEFLNAHLTGRLGSLAKLVEGSIGKGAFRILGIMGKDRQSSILVGRTLAMMRREKETKEK